MPTIKIKDGKVVLRRGFASCICYIECPEILSDVNLCDGAILTQTCFLGWRTTGQKTVTKTVMFEGITCKDLLININYTFGFSPDVVNFYAIDKDDLETDMGSTGCISGSGNAVFTLPALSKGIKAISTFACSGNPNLNSSIDRFFFTCMPIE